ncbi:MAG: sulfoacetaldehyde dehydrogenase [Chloroflexota bacterium]|nr:sulfoacetaldehyde dehydrogenase [Chloroflexota bacterium]
MEQNIDVLIERARKAQQEVEFWPQDKVNLMVAAAAWETYKPEMAQQIARLAVEETGMGLYEHKLLKHQKKTLGTLRDMQGVKTVGVIEEIPEKGLIKIAKPVGVIGALTPVTNCEATFPAKALPALKCRNAIIFAPHPRAKKTAALVVDSLRAGFAKVGAPLDLIQTITEPSIDLSKELMSKVDLVVATGGGPMVKSAYSSGTPAYGVGAGNAVVIVDETADLQAAAQKIYQGKTFDNATSCSSENSVVLQAGIYAEMVANLQTQGGYWCSEAERAQLQQAMWPDGVHLNKEIVAQPVQKIAALAGLEIPEGTTFLMVAGHQVGNEDPFCKEKLSLVLTVWKYEEFEEAIQLVEDITALNGRGHSCGIHTNNDAHVLELGRRAKVSRMMVNQAHSLGNSGNYNNGMPFTLTLGCGTWGGNITTENLHCKHFMNVTWVSKPIEPVVPSEEELFAPVWQQFGK